MPTITKKVNCDVERTFRVEQIAGMFDLVPNHHTKEEFSVEIPRLDEPWKIGAIVGPSGSGKSTIAREAFGPFLYEGSEWSHTMAIVDGLGDGSIRDITKTLSAVGLSSPPAWLKPYHVLSTGQQFRCDLAKALLTGESLVAFDEFTSVVDRTVAQVASEAVAKAIRRGSIERRLVVVTCHYDILEWLQPDWVVDMATGRLARGALQPRQPIKLRVVRGRQAAWPLFARHHYLSGKLVPMSQIYLALWGNRPVAFCALTALYGFKNRRRIHRLVTLPDYQGIGIGTRLMHRVCQAERHAGRRVNITTSHPAMIGYCRLSEDWKTVSVAKQGRPGIRGKDGKRLPGSAGRSVVSFEFTGEVPREWSAVGDE